MGATPSVVERSSKLSPVAAVKVVVEEEVGVLSVNNGSQVS